MQFLITLEDIIRRDCYQRLIIFIWGGRIRTYEWRIQKPQPYPLATPHFLLINIILNEYLNSLYFFFIFINISCFYLFVNFIIFFIINKMECEVERLRTFLKIIFDNYNSFL